MNKIKLDGNYRLRSGKAIRRVLAVDVADDMYPVLIELAGGVFASYSVNGEYSFSSGSCHSNDLVEISPYDHIKVGDRVLVGADLGNINYRRYFAGASESGKALTFEDGRDEWTNEGRRAIPWEYCTLWEEGNS